MIYFLACPPQKSIINLSFSWGIKGEKENSMKRPIITIGIIVFIIMGLFPPWKYTLNAQGIHIEKPAGYALIIYPPKPEIIAEAYGVRVDISRLVIQWIILAVATGGALFITNKQKQKE
jgi:hypothetical protein